MHSALILLGSNISPRANVRAAIRLLGQSIQIKALSSVWKTAAVGSHGPDFLNMAVLIHSELETEALKWQVLRKIEARLGRVRGSDAYAPRTIDLDILVMDNVAIDGNLWTRSFAAIPAAELLPELKHPDTGQTLTQVANRLSQDATATRVGPLAGGWES